MDDKRAPGEVDRAVAAFAARRWGVFRQSDVESLGLSRPMASNRVKAGRLFRLHRGVYSVVPRELLKVEGRWLAAVLASGPGAVLSHTAAAALWRIRAVPVGPIHVTVAGRGGRRQRGGIVVHRPSTLRPSQVQVRRSIPVTSPARTLADLHRTLPRPQYDAALRKAEILRLDTGDLGTHEPTITEFERRLLALCRRYSLPSPASQQIVGPFTVDFLWREVGLIVEMDDFGTHGTRTAFESDRARDAWLVANGYRVVRLTWRQLHEAPGRIVSLLRLALRPRRPPPASPSG